MIFTTHFFFILILVIQMQENVLFFLKNKSEVKYLYGDMTIAQGIEEMKKHKFTSTPVIDEAGHYLGSVQQGDFLWAIYNNEAAKKLLVKSILQKDSVQPASIDKHLKEILKMSLNQNYIPIVDDRHVFIGIVTRKSILAYFLNM